MSSINNYKFGQWHGKLRATKKSSEDQIQRNIFYIQKLKLHRAKNDCVIIRIFGYEIPLKPGSIKSKSVDLIGYDENYNLYLIELKKRSNGIDEIVKQINDYTKEVSKPKNLRCIEQAFWKAYFLKIKFKKPVKKIILVCEYKSKSRSSIDLDIDYARFRDDYAYSQDIDITEHKPREFINIHLVK